MLYITENTFLSLNDKNIGEYEARIKSMKPLTSAIASAIFGGVGSGILSYLHDHDLSNAITQVIERGLLSGVSAGGSTYILKKLGEREVVEFYKEKRMRDEVKKELKKLISKEQEKKNK